MTRNFNGWHVLHVKTGHEKRIQNQLIKSSLEVFLPTIAVLKQWTDRKKVISSPLFPSYVFVYLHSVKDFYDSLNIRGVFNFVRFDNCYATLTNEDIEKIRLLMRIKDVADLQASANLPKVGELRKINSGPLSGFYCNVLQVNQKGRIMVHVTLNSWNQNITATIPLSYLDEPSAALQARQISV